MNDGVADSGAEDSAQLSVLGPGQLLAKARRALKLTPEEVAGQLNLTPATVVALEQDDYDQLPGLTFARGYLRAYARLLGLNHEEILRLCRGAEPSPESASASTMRSKSGSHPIQYRRRWALSSLLGICVLAYTAWWVFDNKREAILQPLEESSSGADSALKLSDISNQMRTVVEDGGSTVIGPAINTDPVLPAPGELAATDGSTAPGVEGEALDAEITESSSLEENGEVTESLTATASFVSDPLQEETALGVDESAALTEPGLDVSIEDALASAQSAVVSPVDTTTEEVEEAPAADPTDQDMLVIRTSGPSWVEIFDADNRRLVFDMLLQGDVRRLNGRPPFNVVLGNAPVVELQYQGESIDLTDATRPSKTAQITLGTSENQ